jgi:L-cysteate sulfo-lyase
MPSPAPLATWPTPLEPAPRLSEALGLRPDDLRVKRDDLTGLGGGGNKVRKLQWTCGAALAEGATAVVTTGAAQSNHARLTAAAGARLGLRVVLVLEGTAEAPVVGNLVLDGLLGAEVRWAGDVNKEALAEAAAGVVAELQAEGESVSLIPFGGSSAVGARGYVECGEELLVQCPDLEHVAVAVGSGGTMAGLVHALGAERVLGVHCGAVADPLRVVSGFVEALATPGGSPPAERLRLRGDQVGDGYGHLTDAAADALRLAARTEGLVLDPVYTGRMLAGLRAEIAEGGIRPGQRTVLLHSGGLPGLLGHPEMGALA